ncbi:MAG: hypothetical protein ACFCUI_05820 [Bernardetiaceae bacterium]
MKKTHSPLTPSGTYIDAKGKLCGNLTRSAHHGLPEMLGKLPPIVSLLLGSLLIAKVLCAVGLCQALTSQSDIESILVYALLLLISGLLLGIGISLAWLWTK